jgi:hypothetical protein
MFLYWKNAKLLIQSATTVPKFTSDKKDVATGKRRGAGRVLSSKLDTLEIPPEI